MARVPQTQFCEQIVVGRHRCLESLEGPRGTLFRGADADAELIGGFAGGSAFDISQADDRSVDWSEQAQDRLDLISGDRGHRSADRSLVNRGGVLSQALAASVGPVQIVGGE